MALGRRSRHLAFEKWLFGGNWRLSGEWEVGRGVNEEHTKNRGWDM